MTLRSGTAQALDPVRSAFALAALLSVLLNFGVVVLAPLFQFECAPEPIEERTPNARRLGVPVPAAARSTPGRGQIAEAWSCLHPVDPDTLRLLPDSSALAQQARQKPRWLFFGLSSVHRKQAEYLGITLSHLFDALGDSTDTGLVIHLADFDESWVAQTQDWLKTGFEDEVQENRMHVIHAPERLYPAKAEVMKYTKYGDPPLRQWWRAKQNLDYAFLMWYAANLSEYYMQLEDDVQVTPNFLPTVRRFMHEKLTGDAWVMAAFSKLGFIGKLFHSSRLPKLAEFLLIFHGEAPCDWLVWVFIDAVSSQPVDILIPQDLEDEHNQRESAKSNPNVKLSKSMRTDVLLYYKEKKMPVFLSNPAPVIQKITPPPAPLDTAPSSASSGSLPVRARVHSTMQHWQQYAPAMAYMVSQPGVPGTSNKRGFWSSDTCHPSRTAATALCDPTKKFLQVIFDQPLHVSFLKLSMGAPDHPQDYVRNGTLEAGFELFPQDQSLCKSYIALAPVNAREVSWQGQLVHAVKCLRVRLLATQQEWVMIKFEEILEAGSSLTTVTTSSSETRNVVQATSQHLVVPILSTAAPASSAPTTAAGQPGRPTAVPANPQAAQVSPLRHRMFLRLQAYQHEDHQDVFSTMIASSVGLISGLSGWVNVFLCRRLCLEGASLVGQFPCWISGFLPVIDSLLFMSLKAPNATVQCDPLEPQERKLSRQEQTLEIPWWSNLPVRWQQAKQQATLRPSHRRLTSLTRWADLFTPARRLAANLQELLHLGFSPEQPKKWLAVGMRFKVGDGELEEPLQVVGKLLEAGGVQMLVLLHLSDETEQQHSRVLERLRQRFSEEIQAGRLLAVRAPEEHYVDQRREHYELAALFTVAGSISDFYVQVEDNIVAQSGFVKFLRDYVSEKMAVNKTTWNMISLGRDGLNRKVVRSKHLIRFAELLPIFPEVPPDSLLWDFVDVINNQSAPKACYIAFSATKMKRHDVILQYHKAEAIIEHVGDVSSLEGKVQRIHDDYFKKHNLLSSLFDNPPADIFAGFHLDPATSNQLQNLYGVHGNSQGMGGAPAVTILAQTLAEVVGKGTFEVVFKRPLSVQMINLRMGGFLRPAAKNKKQPELADPDFDFVFPDAEIALGRGRAPAGLNQSVPRGARPQVPAHGLCSVYEPLTNFSGREFFWRSPTSRPAAGVECVKVTLLEAPKSNVILRTIRIRSLKTTAAARRMTPEETAQVFQPKWQDEMRSWAKNVLVAFGSGALFGSLGFVVTMLPRIQPSKVRRRTKVSQT